jgi:DNA-binding CsgD family transcriptional regulator/lipopolysaccharide biosynthesis regulator YciM
MAAHMGNLDRADELAQEAFEIARLLESPLSEVRARKAVGGVAFQRGNVQKAIEEWEQALSISERHELLDQIPSVLLNLSVCALVNKDLTAAAEYLERAQAAPTSERRMVQGIAAMHIADLEVEQGNEDAAIVHVREALDVASEYGHLLLLTATITTVAIIAHRRGMREEAVRLNAAAYAARLESGFALGPLGEAEVDELRRRFHRGLDDPTFERMDALGKTMPLDEAVEIAKRLLDTFDDPVAELPPSNGSAAAYGLTPREIEIVRLLVDGRSNQEIADLLSISLRTAQTHVANILGKLELPSRSAVAAYAVRNGLV